MINNEYYLIAIYSICYDALVKYTNHQYTYNSNCNTLIIHDVTLHKMIGKIVCVSDYSFVISVYEFVSSIENANDDAEIERLIKSIDLYFTERDC